MHRFYKKCRTNITNNYLIVVSHLIQKHSYTECDRGTVERGIKKIKTQEKDKTRIQDKK